MDYTQTLEYKIVRAMNVAFFGLMIIAAVLLVAAPFALLES